MSQSKRETIAKSNFSRSLGTGIKSLATGGREYFVIEHKTKTAKFSPGDQKEIIVDYIELGRDPKCQIRYDENQKTVSRRHAAITKEGSSWVIKNLSNVNPTLLNGRPVNKKYYLSSGDEIQLSMEGPKLAFIVPANNLTGSLGIGKRMTLFGEQALRPYKRAIYALISLIVLIGAASLFWINELNKDKLELTQGMEILKKEMKDTVSISNARADSLVQLNENLAKEKDDAKKRVSSLERRLRKASKSQTRKPAPIQSSTTAPSDANLDGLYKDVYLITVSNVKVTQTDGEVLEPENMAWQGTGFLTKDNRFVTARHVIEPWLYSLNPDKNLDMVLLNVLLHNYGGKVSMKITAISSGGKKLTFQYKDFIVNRSADEADEVPIDDQPHVIRHAIRSPYDITYISNPQKGDITTNPDMSNTLPAATELYILGYPLGFGASDRNTAMTPMYSTAKVGRPGLENLTILTTNSSIEVGNSGGPVFIKTNGQYEAIGVVSGGWGEDIGRIIPISLIY